MYKFTTYLIREMWCVQEVQVVRKPSEKLGLSIQGGSGSPVGPPVDPADEGVFVSKVNYYS
jgi:hypothetical protein